MKTDFEFIVVGCGGIGSAVLYWLARRAGGEVLGLEQFKFGHENGSSQDVSRVIRFAYHDEKYTRLLPAAFTAWREIENASGTTLFTRTGGVDFALRDDPRQQQIERYAAALQAAGLVYDRLNSAELVRRFPQFHLTEEVDAIYQPDTGILRAAEANAAHQNAARQHGAVLLEEQQTRSIRPTDGGVCVETACETFTARVLILACGAWTDQVLAGVGANLRTTVTQEQVTYFATPHLEEFAVGRFPFFQWHGDDFLYAFPVFGLPATKIGIDAAGPQVTPATRTFEPDPAREERVIDWLKHYVPGFLGPKLYTKTCLYDMTRDRNFVIDALPEYPQILVCAGAGHAYKFAALLGKIMSELAIDGATNHPVQPFSIRRPAITEPDYQAQFHF